MNRFIKKVRTVDEGFNMSDVDFKGGAICCFVHNSLHKLVLQCQCQKLCFVEDLENFESYPLGIDVHEELLRS